MTKVNPVIDESWKNLLAGEFSAPYFMALKEFLIEEKRKYKVFPPGAEIFNAFNHTPFHRVKVVILGQDPYHGAGQAHGLCFSVPEGVAKPPSLQNIFKEINSDLKIPIPRHGNLLSWAQQGVLLINATLTVRAGQAGSHQRKGWENFTDAAIKILAEQRQNLVFLLWGNYAIAKRQFIDSSKHLILTSPHPSPLSASRGFFGNRHFSLTNEYLKNHGIEPIRWEI